jgi:pimeloyl-ACP methyl ester carboxylesterase
MRSIWSKSLLLAIVTIITLGSQWANAFDRSVFDNLDYGIYWYQNKLTSQKATPGVANPYYNNGQPTLIYIHGWQRDKTPLLYRETFDRQSETGLNQDLIAPWKQAGWNAGIFYWNQFGDEPDVKDAEAKIWSINGPKKMRWRKADGSYVDSNIDQTAAQLFVTSYKAALAGYTGNNIRLAGHSLGSQMVVVATKLISDAIDRGEIPANLLPNRVVLLDPAFIGDARPYLNNDTTVELGHDFIDALKLKGVIFESLSTSAVSQDAAIKTVMNETAYRELKPWYFNGFDVVGKHMCAVWHYLWEYSMAPRPITGTNLFAVSASSSNSAALGWMNSPLKMIHDQGAWTKTPGDDNYKQINK